MSNPTAIRFEPTATIPNSDRPMSIRPGAISASEATSSQAERLFVENGWHVTWTFTVFDCWHFHLEGHEVLACVAGAASIGFGGEKAEGAIVVEMKPGDVAIVPAGVGHRTTERDTGLRGRRCLSARPERCDLLGRLDRRGRG